MSVFALADARQWSVVQQQIAQMTLREAKSDGDLSNSTEFKNLLESPKHPKMMGVTDKTYGSRVEERYGACVGCRAPLRHHCAGEERVLEINKYQQSITISI